MTDYGSYKYYVRCKGQDGAKNNISSVIGFEYKNPAPDVAPIIDQSETTTQKYESGAATGSIDWIVAISFASAFLIVAVIIFLNKKPRADNGADEGDDQP